MKKTRFYPNVKFSQEAIQKAWEKAECFLDKEKKRDISYFLTVAFKNERWRHDNEAEFFSDYNKSVESATYQKDSQNIAIELTFFGDKTEILVNCPERAKIEEIHQIFEKYAPKCLIPVDIENPPVSPVIFVGHGQSAQWRDLKDHLHDKHGYQVEAYEVGARAGHTIRDILEDMLTKSSFAILVMTGEDKDEKGFLHARDNVIHELGLFQGRLGFSRAVILLEDGTQEFSNIHGINQIRYSKGKIIETFGEVLATLKREFES